MKFPKLKTRLFDLVCSKCKSSNIFMVASRGATNCRLCGAWTVLNSTDWQILPPVKTVNLAIFELIEKDKNLGARLKEKFFYADDKTNAEKYACYFNIYTYLTEPPVYQPQNAKAIPAGITRPAASQPGRNISRKASPKKAKASGPAPAKRPETAPDLFSKNENEK